MGLSENLDLIESLPDSAQEILLAAIKGVNKRRPTCSVRRCDDLDLIVEKGLVTVVSESKLYKEVAPAADLDQKTCINIFIGNTILLIIRTMAKAGYLFLY